MDQVAELEGKKREIVNHAFDRFYEGGFHATAMEAVLAGSGISKRTLYKYFASKEELIEAVLRLYDAFVTDHLFGPVAHYEDPRDQIVAFFDVDRIAGRMLTRGCLGMKAAQEYAGKDEHIVALGRQAASRGQAKFLELCRRGGFASPEQLAEQLNLIFQGALILSHTSGDTAPFLVARDMAALLLEKADPAPAGRARSATRK